MLVLGILAPPKGCLKPVGESSDQPPTSPGISPISMYLCRHIPETRCIVYFPTFKVSLGSEMQVRYTVHWAYMARFPTFPLHSGHVALGCCTSIPKACACFCSCSTTWLGRSLDFRSLEHWKKPQPRILEGSSHFLRTVVTAWGCRTKIPSGLIYGFL